MATIQQSYIDAVIHPTSWNGLSFTVESISYKGGRAIVTHEFPYRDYPDLEDLGRKATEIELTGFITGTSIANIQAVYDQEQPLLDSILKYSGPGTLIHPTLGNLKAVATGISVGHMTNKINSIPFQLTFILSNPNPNAPNGTVATVSTQSKLATLTDGSFDSYDDGYQQAIEVYSGSGVSVNTGAVSAVTSFVGTALTLCTDAACIINEINGIAYILSGRYDLGRYSTGGVQSAPSVLATVPRNQSDEAMAAQSETIMRAYQVSSLAVANTAASTLETIASGLSPTNPATVPPAVKDTLQAITKTINDPNDQIRILMVLSQFSTPSAAPGATETGNLMSWSALALLANAVAQYQPLSSTAATELLDEIMPIFDQAIINAGNIPDTNAYTALTQLRAAIWNDLETRAAYLPPLIEWETPVSLPSSKLSQYLYATGTRDSELVGQVNPIHPSFCPTSFEALSY